MLGVAGHEGVVGVSPDRTLFFLFQGRQTTVEPLNAVEDASQGEGAAIDIGGVGLEIASHLAGVGHEFVADVGEVFQVADGFVGLVIGFFRLVSFRGENFFWQSGNLTLR